jgi:hypothetical protein
MSRVLILAVGPDSPGSPGTARVGETVNDMSYPHITSQGATRARDAASGPTETKPWWLITDIAGRPLQKHPDLFDRG